MADHNNQTEVDITAHKTYTHTHTHVHARAHTPRSGRKEAAHASTDRRYLRCTPLPSVFTNVSRNAAQASMLALALARDNQERTFEALLNPPGLEETGDLSKENVTGSLLTDI